ncbi:MAG: hypothetical protein IPK44_12675 [Candidatus Accumulibacter sp.]|nr:hypothetical protein [Accumulibacter sp.]
MRDGSRPLDGILQQRSAQLDPMRTMIDGKPAQHDHRHGVRHIAPHGTRGHLVGNGASGDA